MAEGRKEKPGFDTFVLAAAIAEMRPILVGARVQKVQQPTPTEVYLLVYGRAGAQKLCLSAHPQQARVHLTQARYDNPVNAPGFCQVCRKYLDGAIIEAVEMPRFDRVAEFTFRGFDGEKVTLMAELMGRNANVILTSGARVVRGTLRPVPTDAERPLRPNVLYTPPPGYGTRPDPPASADTTSAMPDGVEPARWLGDFSGLGPFAVQEIVARADSAGGIVPALAHLMADVQSERFAPHSIQGADGATVGVWAFRPMSLPPGRVFPRDNMNDALDTFYRTETARAAETGDSSELARALEREIKYRDKEIQSMQVTLDEAARADNLEQSGNNLLAALPRLQAARGQVSVTVPDLYGGPDVTLTLDPKRTLAENAQSYFDRAHKARDAADYAQTRQETLRGERTLLALIADRLDGSNSDERASIQQEFARIVGDERASPTDKTQAVKPAEKAFDGHRIRTFTLGAYTLLVGETADANDYLTTKVASPSDLWMHVRGAPGAHGVLRTANQPSRVPDEIIRRAASVVAARSGSVKHSGTVAVDVTEKRYVRKPRNAKPGQVIIERERTFDVTPQAV